MDSYEQAGAGKKEKRSVAATCGILPAEINAEKLKTAALLSDNLMYRVAFGGDKSVSIKLSSPTLDCLVSALNDIEYGQRLFELLEDGGMRIEVSVGIKAKKSERSAA